MPSYITQADPNDPFSTIVVGVSKSLTRQRVWIKNPDVQGGGYWQERRKGHGTGTKVASWALNAFPVAGTALGVKVGTKVGKGIIPWAQEIVHRGVEDTIEDMRNSGDFPDAVMEREVREAIQGTTHGIASMITPKLASGLAGFTAGIEALSNSMGLRRGLYSHEILRRLEKKKKNNGGVSLEEQQELAEAKSQVGGLLGNAGFGLVDTIGKASPLARLSGMVGSEKLGALAGERLAKVTAPKDRDQLNHQRKLLRAAQLVGTGVSAGLMAHGLRSMAKSAENLHLGVVTDKLGPLQDSLAKQGRRNILFEPRKNSYFTTGPRPRSEGRATIRTGTKSHGTYRFD